jgi:hypothetical protein
LHRAFEIFLIHVQMIGRRAKRNRAPKNFSRSRKRPNSLYRHFKETP